MRKVKANSSMFKVLKALMVGSNRSDREVSRSLDISQPTVSRQRERLEKGGFIREYTLIPDFSKVGIQFIAFSWLDAEFSESVINEIKGDSKVIFACKSVSTSGIMLLSLHKNYSSFSDFSEFWRKLGKSIKTHFLCYTDGDILKGLTLSKIDLGD